MDVGAVPIPTEAECWDAVVLATCDRLRGWAGAFLAPAAQPAALARAAAALGEVDADESVLAIVVDEEDRRGPTTCVVTSDRVAWLGPGGAHAVALSDLTACAARRSGDDLEIALGPAGWTPAGFNFGLLSALAAVLRDLGRLAASGVDADGLSDADRARVREASDRARRLTEAVRGAEADPTARPLVDDLMATVALASARRIRPEAMVLIPPRLPERPVHRAMLTYLKLRPGERLVALLDASRGKGKAPSLALTDRALIWCLDERKARRALRTRWMMGPTARDLGVDAGAKAAEVPYRDLPRLPRPGRTRGFLDPRVELPWGLRHPALPGPLRRGLAATVARLAEAARTGLPSADLDPSELDAARADLPTLDEGAARIHAEERAVAEFRREFADGGRAVVTPWIFAACVLAFLVVLGAGGYGRGADPMVLMDRGALFGPFAVLDGEAWRLASSVFLHGGLGHLVVNMWCLARIGPLIERLYGPLAFAAIYALSGLGGSLLSLLDLPTTPVVGASGAIFGLCGALLAFLARQPRAIPPLLVRPLRASAWSFVVINVGLGLLSPGVANAAHVGGLAVGVLAGWLMMRPWPARLATARPARRLLGAAALGLALAACYPPIAARVAADPQAARLSRAAMRAGDEFNALVVPVDRRIVGIDRDLGRLVDRAGDDLTWDELADGARGLLTRANRSEGSMGGRLAGSPELAAILEKQRAVQRGQARLIEGLLDAAEDQNNSAFDEEGDYTRRLRDYERGWEEYAGLRDAFLEKYGAEESGPGDAD
jgi:membrane associated rhomboid family serine protease